MERERFELHKVLVGEISKGMEQVKQVKASSSNDQDRVLETMLASYRDALSILTGTTPDEQSRSVITSSLDPPGSPRMKSEMERKNPHPTNRDGLLYRSGSAATTSSEIVLQWGKRKRLRCVKVHGKDNKSASNDPAGSEQSQRAAVRVDRRVVRSDLNNNNNNASKNPIPNPPTITNGYLNLRHRPASPSRRILRNSESPIGMRGHSNGVRGLASADRGERKATSTSNNVNTHHHNSNHNNDNHHHGGGGGSGSSETALDGKKGGLPSGVDAIAAVWPPKFVIALTNKEKEEDFLAIKGSKLPQRPKKRAKLIQRTLNLVSPGAWLCDLTLERYEVREKKVSKKRPRGLRAMGNNNMDSDSE